MFNFFVQRNSLVYARALFIQLCWLIRARRLASPIWDLWLRSASAWNEEPGETSLSHLSRIAAGDTFVGDSEHMNALYCLQGVRKHLVAPDFVPGQNSKRGGQRIEADSPDVTKTRDFLLSRIEHLLRGDVEMYVGNPSTWEVKRASITHEGTEVVEDWRPRFHPGEWDDFAERTIDLIERADWVTKAESDLKAEQGARIILVTPF